MHAIILALLCCSPLRITTTGDSLTNGYSPRLGGLLSGFDAELTNVAQGGITAQAYYSNGFHTQVLDSDPDVIAFMLGTNNAYWGGIEGYTPYAEPVFDAFGSFVNSRGNNPRVLVMTLLPILNRPEANDRVDNQYNPWLEQQATQRGFELLDVNAAIQTLPNWQGYYSDNVHLWTEVDGQSAAGYWWLAEQIIEPAGGTLVLPEPSTGLLLVLALVFVAGYCVGTQRTAKAP